MKLEEGMYVRFKDKKGATYIRKLTKLANEYPQKLYGMEIDVEANYSPYLSLKNIIKASNNIIDLIEEGDVITYEFPTGLGMLKYENVTVLAHLLDVLKSSDEYKILSIITREQIESMQYKVD